ncbi:helix-turn-helix domain-containing protein [Rhodalgimonas zhirmunskyi]|uniref:Helix-turn-helix domain-containing protein n=1 Tax=Rhodalgimonas zhirmunskyi TaxID=2964767 RepID=A0AAJ1UB24_9RHOB|nr:helix-turn-helix transcriptional regulator [Rhodoalgimonas zhirmunskyi]MDQ2093281.1 helix-turn-helix domain-containing protein [Rhodoalgimonas zhirmunskyi]
MTKTRKRKKREILPPLRHWPPAPQESAHSEGIGDDSESGSIIHKGLAGADDIVQCLALLMNEKNVSYEEVSRRSDVPQRTIKKWFSANEKARTTPRLDTIQACFEALGHSMIVSPPSVQIGNGQHIYPIEIFRQKILDDWIAQSARARGQSVTEFINDLEARHSNAIRNRTKGFRQRDF